MDNEEVVAIINEGMASLDVDGKRVLLIVPDGTRTVPLPLLFRSIHAALAPRVAALDVLIALGTHQPMTAAQIDRHLGVLPGEWETTFRGVRAFNHRWDDPKTFASVGVISASEIETLSNGLLAVPVEVRINRMALEYDCLLICGPVFPHEVVGFSGGNKYLFPGISGREVIDVSHWLGALITSYVIIGAPSVTPVRRLIDRAASLVPTPKHCVAVVVAPENGRICGIFIGSPEEAWQAAAHLSAQVHIRYVDRPFQQVLSVVPTMYQDMWTAAKGMYKVEPVVADGGEVIIYAPHITEFSVTHGATLAAIGYHVRDYFVKQWDRFRHYPWSVLAHSTHLAGVGEYDPLHGERPRIRVTLATGISAERCAAHNVGYRDPATIDPAAWAGRETEGVLLVPRAGEMLYRLRNVSAQE
ncbi:MAG: lactate racemase domain-containing protein [Roseiflexus sp.]|nr:lactate racemase domain-containing protein [Roseiflexus sp.]MDW8148298.1 lactate racemase domain-containing protein [Roseiflexaceae bacterium]